MRLRTRQQYRRMNQKSFKFVGCWILADVCLYSNNLKKSRKLSLKPKTNFSDCLGITLGPFSRLGITVTKRYGSACQRNRFKRLIREVFRLSAPHFKHTFDVVIRPRSQALEATFDDIQQEFSTFLEKIYSLSQEV